MTVGMYETIYNEEELQVLLETHNDDNTSSDVNGHEEELNDIIVRDIPCTICEENVANPKKCSSCNQGIHEQCGKYADRLEEKVMKR